MEKESRMEFGQYEGVVSQHFAEANPYGLAEIYDQAYQEWEDACWEQTKRRALDPDRSRDTSEVSYPVTSFLEVMLHVRSELAWVRDHRPSYQIDGPLLDGLLNTRLDLQAKHLRFPRRSFAIELPLSGPHAIDGRVMSKTITDDEARGSGNLAAILVSIGRNVRMPEGEWHPWIFNRPDERKTITFDSIHDVLDCWKEFSPGIPDSREDQIIITTALIWSGRGPEEDPMCKSITLAPDTVIESVSDDPVNRLVIGAALFAVGANNKFIDRVTEPRSIRRRRERDKKKGKPHAPEFKRWRMGANIALPNRGTGSAHVAGGSESRLQWAHTRQGFLRRQRIGPRSTGHYQLKYVRPTIVRPDLGFPSSYQASKHSMWQPKEGRS